MGESIDAKWIDTPQWIARNENWEDHSIHIDHNEMNHHVLQIT